MNRLCTDIGYKSLNHAGEQLCGDQVEIQEQPDGSLIAVLADGLGSGVKASILSTLTAKIISTMLAAGLRLEECVDTIAKTLPVCSERHCAYSTFTILQLLPDERAILIQYENPAVILLREGKSVEYPKTSITVGDKTILHSEFRLYGNDLLIALSDGCLYAGAGIRMNYGWQRDNIIEFMQTFDHIGFTAKTLATILVDECNKLYEGEPGDDATALLLRIRHRNTVSVMVGPPADRDKEQQMLVKFLEAPGMHVVCGGTTAEIVAQYLNKPVLPLTEHSGESNIPPMSSIEGIDLVTEGIITASRVLEYAKDYLEENESYTRWSYQKDGAAALSRILFEQATDIHLLIGRAVNPAHQNPELPINFNIKMRILQELSQCLTQMGKRVDVSYY